MQFSRSQRAQAVQGVGICCLVLLIQSPISALLSCAKDVHLDAKEQFLDEVRGLARFLPEGPLEKTVGYYADPAGFKRTGLGAVTEERLCLVQYELAPFAIAATPARPWVICDTDNPAFVPWWADAKWTLVTRLSSGIKLFHRTASLTSEN